MAGEDLAKQKKIRGGHRGHAKKLMGEIQGILDNPPIEKRYEFRAIKERPSREARCSQKS